MFKLSNKQQKELLKTTINNKVSLNDFNKILSNKKFKKKEYNFNFNIKIEKNEIEKYYKITFIGKHYSKNVINTWHRGILYKYKKAIKLAAKNSFLEYNNLLPNKPLNNIKLKIEVYNPVSRDDDANYDTLKCMRDTLTINKLIEDDNRKVIKYTKEKEILSKEYKIIYYIIF